MITDDSDSDDDENDVLIGCLRGDIVGIQYYRGTVFLTNISHYESLYMPTSDMPFAARVDFCFRSFGLYFLCVEESL